VQLFGKLEKINHIQLLCKEQRDEKWEDKKFKGEFVRRMLKITKIKGGKFMLPWKGLFKI